MTTTTNATRTTSTAAFDGIQRTWHASLGTHPHTKRAPLTELRSIDGIARVSANAHAHQAQQVLHSRTTSPIAPLRGVQAILGSLDGIRMPQLARSV